MPASYREPDERSEDHIAYFDYGVRAPFRAEWTQLARGCVGWCTIFFLWALFETMRIETALFVAAVSPLALVPMHLLAQWIRHRQAGALVVRDRKGRRPRRDTRRRGRAHPKVAAQNACHETAVPRDDGACDSPAASRSPASLHS